MIGIIILIGFLILETSLYFISDKKNNFKYKTIVKVRIILFLFCLGLVLFQVVNWTFRYYAIIGLLLLMVLGNLYKFIKHKESFAKNAYNISIKHLVIRFILYSLCLSPAIIFPDYKPLSTTGSYQIMTNQFIITDFNRIETFEDQENYRDVVINVWYPHSEHEIFPLVVYSHGGISLDTSNESLFLELASQGYVVFSIGHPYHSILTRNTNHKSIWIDRVYMNELNTENATDYPEESFLLYRKWMKLRTDDINFVIDYAKSDVVNQNHSIVFERIDKDHIAVTGHSLGGSAALCIGRTRSDIQAIIALESPYMCDIIDVIDQQFIFNNEPYPIPVLNIYSDSAWPNLSIWPQYEQNYRMLSSNDSVVLNVHIEGSGHFSLTDLSLTSPIFTRMLNGFSTTTDSRETLYMINRLSLEFLGTYLKN